MNYNKFQDELRLFRLEEKWKHLLDSRGVINFIDRLILADLFEAKQENKPTVHSNGGELHDI